MASSWKLPEVRKAGDEESTQLRQYFKGLENSTGFIRVGDAGYLFPSQFEKAFPNIYNMEVRSTDTYVVTFPRSGTTWTQEMVWLIHNDLDYAKAASLNLVQRYVHVGNSAWYASEKSHDNNLSNENAEEINKLDKMISPGYELLNTATDPRFVKTHLPLCMLPPNLIDTAKVVYVARDPRDVAVSLYHLSRLFKMLQYTGDFKTFWNMFINDNIIRTPYFEHVKEAWKNKNHPNMLFLFYEELKKDLPSVIKRTVNFFNKNYTEQQISELCNHLDIENFRNNNSVNFNFLKNVNKIVENEQPFIRKGKVGGWREYFDEQMTIQSELWIAEQLRDTNINFHSFEDNHQNA